MDIPQSSSAGTFGVLGDGDCSLQDVRAGIDEDNLAAVSILVEGILRRRRIICRAVALSAFVFEVDKVSG